MRNRFLKHYRFSFPTHIVVLALLLASFGMVLRNQISTAFASDGASRLITIHDRGKERSVISGQQTLREVFREIGLTIDPNDIVEPGLDEELVVKSYQVNVYRARPITIVDGATKIRVMSAYQTPRQIVEQTGQILRDEDKATMSIANDLVNDGASIQLHVDRATAVRLMLYGKETTVYTQGLTVGDFLKEKHISLEPSDTLSRNSATKITPNMSVQIWRNGVQTLTQEEVIEPPVETIMDVNQPVGYEKITSEGRAGTRSIAYEVTIEDGRELSRTEIQNVITRQPEKRVIVIGAKTSDNPLTKSKGAHYFIDRNGVSHRETYYDLPMNVVMNACGASGAYTVRSSDGAKVDKDGYVIIAAHLGNYPRCSVVETSIGLGKVYDTGGFTTRHPHGFDLATDWTNNDGR